MNKFEASINVFSFTLISMRDRLSRRRDIELWQFLVCRPHHCLVFCLFCLRAWSWIWHAWSMGLKVFIVWLLDSTRLTTGFMTISFTCWIYNLVFGDCQLILLACWAGFNHAYSPSLFLCLFTTLSLFFHLFLCSDRREAHPKLRTHFMWLRFIIRRNFACQIEIFSAFSCSPLVCACNYNATIYCRLKYF